MDRWPVIKVQSLAGHNTDLQTHACIDKHTYKIRLWTSQKNMPTHPNTKSHITTDSCNIPIYNRRVPLEWVWWMCDSCVLSSPLSASPNKFSISHSTHQLNHKSISMKLPFSYTVPPFQYVRGVCCSSCAFSTWLPLGTYSPHIMNQYQYDHLYLSHCVFSISLSHGHMPSFTLLHFTPKRICAYLFYLILVCPCVRVCLQQECQSWS